MRKKFTLEIHLGLINISIIPYKIKGAKEVGSILSLPQVQPDAAASLIALPVSKTGVL
jgi:hypothetical protein